MLRRLLNWIGGHERATLLSLAFITLGAWAFLELADEVMEGETASLDEQILLSMRSAGDISDPIGPGWFEETMRDFTGLGGFGILILLVAAAAGYLLLRRKARQALYLVIAVGSGTGISTVLKLFFDRPRPDLVPHGQIVYTHSFPSGHAMMSAVAFLTLGALLARSQPHRSLRAYLLGMAVLLTLLVGLSRIYLGVHWPTDVLAGWTAGAIWALLCWSVARALQRRGNLEDETGPTRGAI